MSFAFQTASRAYASVGLETDVSTVEPVQLIVMLYDGALLSIAKAREHMLAHDIARKGESVGKAVRIIDEGLKASLDVRVGGELGRHLWQLYEYMCRRVLLASIHNDPAGLDEVTRLLSDLKDAWCRITPGTMPVLSGNVVPLAARMDQR